MARPHKIWWWEQRGEYAVDIAGRRHRLGTDREKAVRQMHGLLARGPQEKVDPQSAVALMDKFLDEATFKSEETRGWYCKYLQSFTDFLKGEGLKSLTVEELAPHHVHKWLKSHKTWSDGTRNGACRAVQRTFRWANQMGYIKVNPLAFIPDKPSANRREAIITPEEFRELLSYVRDEDFRDLLTVSWECGCRPQESLRVERRHVNEKLNRWEFPAGEGKKTKKKVVRYVYLTENAMDITRRLMVRSPGKLFPFTPHSVNCQFTRIRQRMGKAAMAKAGVAVDKKAIEKLMAKLPETKKVEGREVPKTEAELRCEAKMKLTNKLANQYAPKYCLYMARHSFAERLRQAGVQDITVSALLGHADLSMLGRTYAHPHANPQTLLEELKKGVIA